MKQVGVASILFIVTSSVSSFQGTPGRLAGIVRDGSPSFHGPKSFQFLASSPTGTDSFKSDTVSKAQEILDEFHESNLNFRVVVIGNGAILETTSKLGRKCV
jgi:hypothetical protein